MSIFADRVKETSTSTGASTFTLAGAVTGFRTFNAAQGLDAWFDYCIEAVDGSGVPTGEWEVGQGYLSNSTTLNRSRIYASSNSNNIVTFSAGTKHVFLTYAAQRGFTQGQGAARAFGLEMS